MCCACSWVATISGRRSASHAELRPVSDRIRNSRLEVSSEFIRPLSCRLVFWFARSNVLVLFDDVNQRLCGFAVLSVFARNQLLGPHSSFRAKSQRTAKPQSCL